MRPLLEVFRRVIDSPTSVKLSPFIRISIAYMLWEIWKGRNSSRFAGQVMRVTEIMRHVTQWLRSTHSLVPNKTKCLRFVCEAFGLWGLHIISTQTWTTIRSVRWTPPRVGQWKLNVDGASQGNPGPSGGGGILHDSTGCILFAFSNFYNIRTNTEAEAMAIRDGLLLCEEQNITNIVLESDSKVLVDMLRADSCPHWRLKNIWADIMRCRGRITTITHQFREGNQIANALATHGVRSHRRTVFSFWQDMPIAARGAHRLERLGIPSLRIHRTPLPAPPRQWRIAWRRSRVVTIGC
ncbi:unnamed protein product [Spirodela intermedia]|uniref:RNase H type-1 domain-containing protein n=1 Tax=Spirodela intermedia TaxID=51605 RepID=A0A7I8KQH6_SPIIN|nr:unnamed protein product [Spirodela intermedia]